MLKIYLFVLEAIVQSSESPAKSKSVLVNPYTALSSTQGFGWYAKIFMNYVERF